MKMHRVREANLRFACELEIAGLACRAQSNSGDFLKLLSDSWQSVGNDLRDGFAMQVTVAPGIARIAISAPHFRGMQHLVFATFHSGDIFVFDLLRRGVMAVVSNATAGDSRFWNRVLIPIAMGVLGPNMRTAPLHCACLARGTEGVLIAGESGAGKSTLSVALAQRGFDFVSDDWTYVRKREASGLVAHGLRVPAKLLPDCAEFFPELRELGVAVSLNGELAYEAEVDKVLRGKVRDKCHVQKVILLRRSEGVRARLTRVDGSVAREFFHRSAERLPAELEEAARNRAEAIDALEEVECALFEYGGNPAQGAEALSRLLEGRE